MRHGYTNRTDSDGDMVVKRYLGPGAALRRGREAAMLAYLSGRLPVPPLLPAPAAGDCGLRLGLVPGTHGQDLIAAGHADAVLRACGGLLTRVQAVDVAGVGGSPGQVLVHGDFGPNNLLLHPFTFGVCALLDWEWSHPGMPIEDLAWCEWIVRMHHPPEVPALAGLFAAYGARPSWPDRQGAMIARCEELVRFCDRWEPAGPGARMWRERVAVTAGWVE